MVPRPDIGLIVYGSKWCGDCFAAKRFLRQHNIPFSEVDIDEDPDAAEELMRRTGKRAVPQFVLNGQWFQPYKRGQGFLHAEMKQLLGIRDPAPETVEAAEAAAAE